MELKDFPNTRAIPVKSVPDRKSMPNLDYKLLKEKKAQALQQTCMACLNHQPEGNLGSREDCVIYDEVAGMHREGEIDEWLLFPNRPNGCELWEPRPIEGEAIESLPIEAQTNINLVDRSAPSVDNDRKDIKDRKKHRVRFRNEPDGIREKEFEGMSDYHNVHRTDGEDRYNDPGDPRRGY